MTITNLELEILRLNKIVDAQSRAITALADTTRSTSNEGIIETIAEWASKFKTEMNEASNAHLIAVANKYPIKHANTAFDFRGVLETILMNSDDLGKSGILGSRQNGEMIEISVGLGSPVYAVSYRIDEEGVLIGDKVCTHANAPREEHDIRVKAIMSKNDVKDAVIEYTIRDFDGTSLTFLLNIDNVNIVLDSKVSDTIKSNIESIRAFNEANVKEQPDVDVSQ